MKLHGSGEASAFPIPTLVLIQNFSGNVLKATNGWQNQIIFSRGNGVHFVPVIFG
jgi:hypothetical protein